MTETLAYPGGAFTRARPLGTDLIGDPHRLSPMPYASLHLMGWRLPHEQLQLLEPKAHGQHVVFPHPVLVPHSGEWGEMWCMTRGPDGELEAAVLPHTARVDWSVQTVRDAVTWGAGMSRHPPFASVCVIPDESPYAYWGDEPIFMRVWNLWPVTQDEGSVLVNAGEHALGTSGWHELDSALEVLSEDWGLMDLQGRQLMDAACDGVQEIFGDPIPMGIVNTIVRIVETGGPDELFTFKMPLRPEHEEIWRRLLRLSRKYTPRAVDLAHEMNGSWAAHNELGASPWV